MYDEFVSRTGAMVVVDHVYNDNSIGIPKQRQTMRGTAIGR